MPRRSAPKKNAESATPLNELQAAYSKFHLHCRDCNNPFSSSDLQVNIGTWLGIVHDVRDVVSLSLSSMRCDTCKAWTCTGCGRKPNTKKSNTDVSPDTLQICCEKGRLFGIWLALCQFDEYELESQVPKAKAKKSKARKAPKGSKHPKAPKAPKGLKAPKPWADTGVGYDIGDSWDDDYDDIVPNVGTSDTSVIKGNDLSDNQMIATLDILSRLLQTPDVAAGSSSAKDE
jgi:hypothetical protein